MLLVIRKNQTNYHKKKEKIEYKNLFYRLVGYAFMDLNKFMTTYQEELTARIELEKAEQ